MLTVYGDIQSGNSYKIRLLLTLLYEPHNWQNPTPSSTSSLKALTTSPTIPGCSAWQEYRVTSA